MPAGSGRTVNFSAAGCNPPVSVCRPDGPGGENACSCDDPQDTEICPASEKLGFLGRSHAAAQP